MYSKMASSRGARFQIWAALATPLCAVTTSAFQAVPSRTLLGARPLTHTPHLSLIPKTKPDFPSLFLQRENYALGATPSFDEDTPPFFKGDSLVADTSRALLRVNWFSWWSQVILTSVSSVILIFARNVGRSMPVASARSGAQGFFLAGTGIATSMLSILWTWGGARLSRRLKKRDTSRISASNMMRRAIKVGVSVNIVGMLLTLVGAEQIVGLLAVKVLTMQGAFGGPGSMAVATQTLQPLDILVVQANTNTMLSHFISLVCSLYLTNFVEKLDPRSIDEDERKRK